MPSSWGSSSFPSFIGLLTDWWWFREIGYQIVFTRELVTRVLLFLVVGGLTSGLLYLNLRIAQRGLIPNPVVLRFIQSAPRVDITRPLRRLSLPVSLGLGLLAGLAATPAWELVLQVIYRTPFGITDPVFARDIGYLRLHPARPLGGARLPVHPRRHLAAAADPDLRAPGRHRPRPPAAQHRAHGRDAHRHPAGGVLFVLTALRLWLVDIPSLLYSTTGPLVGASYTDLHATLPALRISAIAAVIAAVAVIWGGVRQRAAALRAPGHRRLHRAGRRGARSGPGGDAEVRGGAHRADPGDAVSPASHRRDPPGVGHRQRGDPGAERRGQPHAGRHPGQRADHRERAALGPRSAAEDLRPAPGDPHLLRLRLGGRRPLLDRRAVPAGAALAPRAEPRVAADADLHQRAPHLHPRHGAHAEPGQPGDARRPAGAVRQGPAAGLDRVAQAHAARRSTTASSPTTTSSSAPSSGSSTTRRARRTSTPPTRARAACRWAMSCAEPPRRGSAPRRSCSRRTSPTTAGCSTTATSWRGRRRRCRSSASIAIPTW